MTMLTIGGHTNSLEYEGNGLYKLPYFDFSKQAFYTNHKNRIEKD